MEIGVALGGCGWEVGLRGAEGGGERGEGF